MKSDKCGIYEIRSKRDAKRYVGSSVRIYGRWYGHRRYLRKGTHHSRHLQNAWNKHGEENFEFFVIEECSKDLLIDREDFYIRLLKPEYNVCPGADVGSFGRSVTHCPKGHEYSSGNTALAANGGRLCRTCNRERVAKIYANETPEQTRVRLAKNMNYHVEHRDERLAQQRQYMAAHKTEKSSYDKSRRAISGAQRRERYANMTAEEKAVYLERRRLDNLNCDKVKQREYNRARYAINNARRRERISAMTPEQKAAYLQAKRESYARCKANAR